MIPEKGTFDCYEDRFVTTWRERAGSHRRGFRGKRLAKDCPLTREEVRAYITGGVIMAIKKIRERKESMSLSEAADIWKAGQKWSNGGSRYVVQDGKVVFRKSFSYNDARSLG